MTTKLKNNQGKPDIQPLQVIKPKKKNGGVRPNSGRKPGSKNMKTMQWEEFGSAVIESNLPKINEYFDGLKGFELFEAWLQVVEYFKPKLQRTDFQALDKNGDKSDLAVKVIIE